MCRIVNQNYCSSGFIGLLILVSTFLLGYSYVGKAARSPVVQIKNGSLEGMFMRSREGRKIVAFKGIPYAEPPIGELRFEPPAPSHAWTGIRSAKKDAAVCPQRDSANSNRVTGSEDCLYLNVYTPKLFLDGKECTNRTVMIWFYGGGWVQGSAHSSLYGPTFLLDHDIVLVTVNYRLGALGFLSTEDLVAPGNQGMKDQAQSLRWVHENIEAFGGDPNLVTIFGESAGAANVHYLMISPITRGLFHRAISQSGSIYLPYTLYRPGVAKDHTKRLGKRLDCPTEDSKALIDCLKKKDAESLVLTDDMFQVFNMCPLGPYRAVVEPDHPGAFLVENPILIAISGNVMDIPWIAGLNAHEGTLRVASLYGSKGQELCKVLDEKFMEIAPISLFYDRIRPKKFKDDVSRAIRKFYLGDKKIDESTRMNMVDMYTDSWFYYGVDAAVRNHFETLSSPLYYYYLTYEGSVSQSVQLGDPDRHYGVAHGDDLQYLFPRNELFGTNLSYTEEDYKMVDLMTTLWVNFARSGNPTPTQTLKNPVKWEPVKTSALEYLHIAGPQDLRMKANLLPERRDFWSSIHSLDAIEAENDFPDTHVEL